MNSPQRQANHTLRPGAHPGLLPRDPAIAPKSYCVLLAHPDLQFCCLLAATLQKDGFRVSTVNSGIEALEWLADSMLGFPERESPDLIVADLNLPGRKGIDLLADMRYADVTIPFILISDKNHKDAAACARKLRWAAVFDGPFDADDFRTAAFVLSRCYRKADGYGKSIAGLQRV